ncbi:MAG: VWA domain-containing protein [Myxococcaceae bacterium]|jgi:Ca-activated chloride channel family protein|nr:VWA domain-containing protein [Myxococcaceae bacterium]MCA3011819.1 VWA domain-containing protein [Myxococcaceae bacterium]
MNRLLSLAAVAAASSAFAQGLLLPTDASLGPLGIKYQRVSAEIVEGTAVTKVEQVFVNSAPRQLEAHYVFPLPKGAALQDFSLWINGKKTKGEVLEKQKATEIYEGIVRRLQDPGLLEYIDSDAFRARVFPVPANGEQKIELTFSQVLDFQSGLYQYHYPLGASSRGAPPLAVKQDFVFSAKLTSKTPIRSVYSPTHKMGVSRRGEGEATAGLELGAGADISKDLDLFYTVSDKAVGFNFLKYRPSADEPGFFVALLSPKTELKADEVMPKRITFVMDTSGSMMGERIKLARESLKYGVQRLNAKDEFNVVRFSTDVEALFEKPQVASEANVKKALDFIGSFEAIGGTAIDEGLQRALKDAEGRGAMQHLVLFVTDGHPTVGVTEEPEIAGRARAGNKGSRLFTFGVGEDLNARLLDRLSDDGRGTSDFARDGRDFEVRVSGLFDKVANPVLADLSLDLAAIGAFDVYPKKLPDLFKGTQLVVTGRYRTPKEATVLLSGSMNGKKQVYEYRADAVKERARYDFVPRLWAIRKVGYLLDEIRLRGEKVELKDEVVALGKKYGIVTPYTSYLVVEDVPASPSVGAMPPPAPWRADDARRKLSASSLGGGYRSRSAPGETLAAGAPAEDDDRVFESAPPPQGAAASAPRGPAAPQKALESADGTLGIAVAKKVRSMKDEERATKDSEPVRVASGRTLLFRLGGWIDAEAVSGTPKQLKVKYLSEAYFAVLRARPELKAALALGSRVVVVVGKDKSLVISPDEGEQKVDAVIAFLK